MSSIVYSEDEELLTSDLGYTILDSGTSLIYLETNDYLNFIDKIQADQPSFDCSGVTCTAKGQICSDLTSTMENLSFLLGVGSNAKYYTLPPSAYAVTQIDGIIGSQYTYSCEILVSQMDNYSILGDTFMRNYVTSFNY